MVGSTLPRLLKETSEFWRLFKKNRAAVIGLVILISFIAVALLQWYLAPKNPLQLWPDTFVTPFADPTYPLGTDDLGRDTYGMLIHGIQVSLIVGFSGVAIALAIGVVVGSLAGYYGGWIEAVLMRVVDLILILPKLLIALVIVALYGQSLWNIIVAIGITCWAPIARITYAQYLSLKERPFVEAAHAIGTKTRRIILREIMPNAAPSIIVNGSLAVGEIILLEASLSYFGLGDPNLVSLGMMLHWAQEWIYRAWWLALFPGIAIFLIVLAFNLIGDGINDALNPRLKEL